MLMHTEHAAAPLQASTWRSRGVLRNLNAVHSPSIGRLGRCGYIAQGVQAAMFRRGALGEGSRSGALIGARRTPESRRQRITVGPVVRVVRPSLRRSPAIITAPMVACERCFHELRQPAIGFSCRDGEMLLLEPSSLRRYVRSKRVCRGDMVEEDAGRTNAQERQRFSNPDPGHIIMRRKSNGESGIGKSLRQFP
jgi:hypothetical protein